MLNTRMFEGPRAVKLSNPNFDIQTINSIVLLEMLDTSSRFPTVHISKSNPCFASKKILRRDTWPQILRTRRTIVSNLKPPSTAYIGARAHFLPFMSFFWPRGRQSEEPLHLLLDWNKYPQHALNRTYHDFLLPWHYTELKTTAEMQCKTQLIFGIQSQIINRF